MQRLAQFDVSSQFLTKRGKVTAQIIFGLVCGAAMITQRRSAGGAPHASHP